MAAPYNGGWRNLRDHLLSWVLSVETGRRHFDSARLVTDEAGAVLLVDRLGLPFDEVCVVLDALDGTDPDLWAMGKLHAYRAQKAPFLHIDSDVYLWRPPSADCYGADVVTTYPEVRPYGDGPYRCASLKADIRRVGGWLPDELDLHVPPRGMLQAENCALLGGRRTDFIAAYADGAIRTVEHAGNRPAWALRRPMGADMLIFEQHMLSAFLAHHAGRPGSPFADVRVCHVFQDEAACFAGGTAAGFTHLLARAKYNAELLERIDRRVRRDHPVLHARVAAVVAGEL